MQQYPNEEMHETVSWSHLQKIDQMLEYKIGSSIPPIKQTIMEHISQVMMSLSNLLINQL